MFDNNPCLSCGACCARFRVSFFWGGCRSAGGTGPDDTVIAISPTYVAMLGTERKPARCQALEGKVGEKVHCTMYTDRSSTCREFHASWEYGESNPHCDVARAAHGLPPLEPLPHADMLKPSGSDVSTL